MNGFKISEAAVQSGFSESALRFYEQQGVVVPERTPAGYRTYNKDDMEALQFVARAKRLGLNLGEISELLSLLEDEQCRPVQDRMRVLVAKRLNETQTKIGEMIAFAGQLQEVAARLGTHTPGGACDDDCGCKFDISNVKVRSLVSLGRPTDVACSLEPGLAPDRIKDWKALLAQAVDRQFVRDGVRVTFQRSVDIVTISELAASEQDCCQFFNFAINITSGSVSLDVTGPEDAQPVIMALFGAPS